MRRWLVIIARDRPELWLTWAAFYGGAETVEVLFDRRQEQPDAQTEARVDRRNRSRRDSDLTQRGHLVISRSEVGGPSH